jgi:hypothetical protein
VLLVVGVLIRTTGTTVPMPLLAMLICTAGSAGLLTVRLRR